MKTNATLLNFSNLIVAGMLLTGVEIGNAKPGVLWALRKPIVETERLMKQDPSPALVLSGPYDLSSSVQTILNPTAPIEKRLGDVRIMGDELSDREISALFSFLASSADVREHNLPGLRALKSDVLAAIEQQASAPRGFIRTMAEMYRNAAQDPVIRDYALQHLVIWCQLRTSEDSGAKEETRKILEMAAGQNNSSAGTALLGLHRLYGVNGSKESEEIDDRALRMASSTELEGGARITAVQVCAERGVTRALPIVESLTESSESESIRVSAVNALGHLGGPKQVPLLRRLASGHDRSLFAAVTAALRQLELTVATQNFH